MFHKIVQVVPTVVYVYFENGKIVCYDVKSLLDKEVFAVPKKIA